MDLIQTPSQCLAHINRALLDLARTFEGVDHVTIQPLASPKSWRESWAIDKELDKDDTFLLAQELKFTSPRGNFSVILAAKQIWDGTPRFFGNLKFETPEGASTTRDLPSAMIDLICTDLRTVLDKMVVACPKNPFTIHHVDSRKREVRVADGTVVAWVLKGWETHEDLDNFVCLIDLSINNGELQEILSFVRNLVTPKFVTWRQIPLKELGKL